MLQQLYDKCVKPSIRECKGQTYYGPSVTPNQLDETLRNINEHLGAIDAEQRIQNSEIQTLKCGNFQNVKISDTLKVDNIQSFSNACIRFLDPVNISDLTVGNLHIECFCADDAAKFAGLSCVEWKEIINCSCVDDTNKFAGFNCTEWKDIISETYINKAKDSDCFSGLTCTGWKEIIKTTCVDNAANSTKFDNKTYAEVCEDILAHVPPQPYSGEIDVYCGNTCLCTVNCENPLVLSENAFNENAKIDTNTYPGACCVGTVTSVNNISPVNGNITLQLPPDLSSCPGLDCIGDVVQSDIQDFITMNDVDECGYTTCTGTVTSVKTCLNGCESNAVTESGTMALDITPSLCFDSTSRKICNKLGNKTSNEITLPSGINCVGTVVQSDIQDFITMSEVDACGYTTCLGTVTSVNNITPVNGNVTLALPPDLSSDVTCLRNDVDAIEGKIPTQASPTNQLADKDFVNSSIETATATFVGTFDDVSCLPTTGVDNNDYAFVTTCDSQTGTVSYTRYKYSDYTHTWICEYTINTTGFTAEQLAALNSGITDVLVAKITDVYNPTICIYSNGACVGSFTLNQSSNKCIGICNDKVSQTLLDTSANRPLLFASASITSGACCGVYYNTNITANSNTGVINATLNGLACRAKCNCVITTTCDCTYYPVFSPNNTSSYKYNYTNANLSYNPSTGTLTALCFNGTAKDSTCFGGCTYDCAKADIRSGLTSCVGTVTSVNACLNGTSATAVTTSGTLSLNITPSLSYTANTRALTTTLGNKTSTAITLPEGINCIGTVTGVSLNGCSFTLGTDGVASLTNFKPATAGTADSATNATCFNGCTYAQACTNIRSGLCSHDCLVKLSLLCSNTDGKILFSAQNDGCICPVYASNGVPFAYNACCGCLKLGDFTCNCCHQVYIRYNVGLVRSGPKGSQINAFTIYKENNCLDNCSLGVGIGSGNIDRGFFDYCKASETATTPTFRWLQYWDDTKEIHNLPIWGELGANNKVVYSCVLTTPSNTRRYALVCFDKTCCGAPSNTSACFEVDIYTSKYYIWIDVANNAACMRTYWVNNGVNPNASIYGGFCTALPNTTVNGNCFWITYSNYRAPVIKSARKISIICNTTTAPTGIAFTAPTNRNSYINVYCGTTCVCTLQGPSELCLSANAFNEYATISETDYPGINKVGTLTSVTINCNGTSLGTITSSGTFNICDQNVCYGKLTSSATSADRNILLMGNGYTAGICRPVWYSDACKLTFNPRNGLLKAGRVSASGYPLKYQQTLNLSEQSADCFYPVTWPSGTSYETDIEIQSPAGIASATYNQNYIHFFERASGWNDMPKTLRIQTLSRFDASENVFGCIGYGNASSQYSVIWLRGGRSYTANANVALTANTTDVTCGDTSKSPSTYTVGTSLCGGTNTRVDVFANATTNVGTYSSQSTYGCFYNRSGCKYILECEVDARGYTTCTGTVTGVSLNGTAFTVDASGVASLTNFKPDTAGTADNSTCFNGCTYAQACTDIRSGLCDHDCLVEYVCCCFTCKYPLLFAGDTSPTSGCCYGVGFSYGNYTSYFEPLTGTFSTCCIKVGNPVTNTASQTGKSGTYYTDTGMKVYGMASPFIEFHAGSSDCYSMRLYQAKCALVLHLTDAYGCDTCTTGKYFTFCANGYLHGCVCGNLQGTASSAVNSTCFDGRTYFQACTNIRNGLCSHDCLVKQSELTSRGQCVDHNILFAGYGILSGCICPIYFSADCKLTFNQVTGVLKADTFCGSVTKFNGCTYSQACNDIRTGLVTSTDLASCGYTTCTGTVSSISLNGNAFTVSNGAATLAGFKPATAVLADCSTAIKRNQASSGTCYLALLGGTTAIDNASIYVSNVCNVTFAPATGTLSSTILCGTSYVRTPILMSASASGVSKVCNVVIRACCTNAECTLTCRNFVFCGDSGRMHGDVCGTLYGNAYNSCLVCRYAVNTGVQHVLLGANCTASANTCVRVSNGCPLTYDPATGTLCTCTICGTVCGNIELAPEHIEYQYGGFLDIYKIGPLVTIKGECFTNCDFVNCLWKYLDIQNTGIPFIGVTGTIKYWNGSTCPTCLIDNLCFYQCSGVCGIQLRKINSQISLNNLCSTCNIHYQDCISIVIPVL